MAFKFESLQIWQKAFDLTEVVHNIAITFPKNEMFICHLKSNDLDIL